MDEKQFKRTVLESLRDHDCFCYAPLDNSHRGVPDVCAIIDGRAVFLELKFQKKSRGYLTHPLTGPQSAFLKDVNNAGGLGLLVVGTRVEGDLQVEARRVSKVGKLRSWSFNNPTTLEEVICKMKNGETSPDTKDTTRPQTEETSGA